MPTCTQLIPLICIRPFLLLTLCTCKFYIISSLGQLHQFTGSVTTTARLDTYIHIIITDNQHQDQTSEQQDQTSVLVLVLGLSLVFVLVLMCRCFFFGALVFWCVGLVEVLGALGVLVCWFAGVLVLVCWCVGMLVCCCVAVFMWSILDTRVMTCFMELFSEIFGVHWLALLHRET